MISQRTIGRLRLNLSNIQRLFCILIWHGITIVLAVLVKAYRLAKCRATGAFVLFRFTQVCFFVSACTVLLF